MEVVDKDDQPIPGLYAVGNDAGGWESDTYDADLSGTTLGFAINSGRIAGENAVKYTRPSVKRLK
jgi:fumarate reductase flavoprotein subunit